MVSDLLFWPLFLIFRLSQIPKQYQPMTLQSIHLHRHPHKLIALFQQVSPIQITQAPWLPARCQQLLVSSIHPLGIHQNSLWFSTGTLQPPHGTQRPRALTSAWLALSCCPYPALKNRNYWKLIPSSSVSC